MRYTLTHLQANGARVARSMYAGTKTADEAYAVVRRATGQDARESIARLDAGVPVVVIPYMDDPSQGVEVRVQ